MQQLTYSALIILGFIVNLQCSPVPHGTNPVQTGSSSNPERNHGLEGGDMIRYPPSTLGRGVAIRGAGNRWTGGVIPYEFASNISANNSIFIVQQMRAMENLTSVNNVQCISFRPKNSTDPYYITIFNGTGCYAPVGSWGNYVATRPVSLLDSPTATCMITGIVQHELTHVLGFYHEQSRPDRDSYVSIQWANIDPVNAFNFDRYNDSDVDTQMTSYDYGSVMHYEWNAFALNSSGPTIIPTQNATAFIGQRVKLSPIDILEIQRYYGCVPTPTTTVTTSTTTSRTTITTTTSTSSTTKTTTTTTRTTTTSATTTTATTQTTTSATTATTTTQTTTATAARNVIQLHLGMYIIWLAAIVYFTSEIH